MLRGAFRDEAAAVVAGLGTEVDDPIGFGDEVEIVFDNEHGVACVDEALDDADEFVHVGHVQADRGLLEDEEVGFTGAKGGTGILFQAGEEVRDEFDPLGLAAAEGGADLAEAEVIQAGVAESLEGAADFGVRGEELEGLGNAEIKDLGDVFAAVFDFEGLVVEAHPLAGFATDEGGREETHLEL